MRELYNYRDLLCFQATNDLDELDKKRREEFKEYEMEKEHERKETLNKMPEEEKKKAEAEYLGLQKKHKDHPKLHHPVRLLFNLNLTLNFIIL
jgi:hypothetical protein